MKNNYRIENGTVYIECTAQGKKVDVLVDEDMLPELLDYKGTVNINTQKRKNGNYQGAYLRWYFGKRQVLLKLHHAIVGKQEKGMVVDHVNHNPLDNRRCNLQIISFKENTRNLKREGQTVHGKHSTGYLNVYLTNVHGVMKYQVRVTRDGRFINLGNFTDINEAIKVRDNFLDNGIVPPKFPNNKSGVRNVSFDKRRNKWVAYSRKNGKKFSIGAFEDLNEAIKAKQTFEEKEPENA